MKFGFYFNKFYSNIEVFHSCLGAGGEGRISRVYVCSVQFC